MLMLLEGVGEDVGDDDTDFEKSDDDVKEESSLRCHPSPDL